MKKTLLLVLALLFANTMFAQNRAGLISENFDDSNMPSGWTISGLGQGNWSISASNKAGGDANELMLYWSPQFNGISRVVTTPVDLTGISEVVISFKHYLDNYDGANTIGIATSSDNGNTWNDAWSQSYSSSGQYNISQVVTTPDMGNSNVLFCLFFSGNAYNINNWYFDNIEIFSQENLDASLSSIEVPSMAGAGNKEIAFQVKNMGISTIESVEVEYEIEGFDPVTETFSVNIPSLETTELSFSESINLIPGTYHLSINIVSVNGTTDDELNNNSMEKDLMIALGAAQRIPMIEHFSSSTCGPCVSVNQQMLNLTNNNPGKYTYTKYAMDWPGSGDPYNTDEGDVRRNYYGVSAVPQTFLDGADQGFAAVTQNALDDAYNTPSFANIRGAFNVEGNTINVIADFMSYVDMTNVRAFVSVNEKTTTGNVGGNGESEFHHIMMTMFDNPNGHEISINAGEYHRLELSYDMSSTHVEEMSDLEVSLWLQDLSTKEMYNSHFAYDYTDHCYPVQNLNISNEESTVVVTWDAPETGTPTAYNVFVNNELVAENTTDLSYSFNAENALYIAEVVAMYDNDRSSVGVVQTFNLTVDVNEYQENTYNIYPNPADNYVRIVGDNIRTVNIYNCLGALVDSFETNDNNLEISTSKYNTGIYFINIQQNNGETSTKKLVITH